ncbi:unnamed protein product [Cercopithifilaria johnstoni]|uniref:Uncharacterized protein n=1 Tax=Cercopithifilaria johnstoni TaxID=2874296 RepID=A0A8J2M824_9BILA|nr:unnamed protein product [Cercopithifilaria johnstoni]
MPNNAQYNLVINENSDFESNNHSDDSHTTEMNESNLKNQNVPQKMRLLKNSVKKPDDIRKITDKLEEFNKNNEISNSPIKTSRPKIEETEMPTKEYGVGRSSGGTLKKGVFH